MTEFPEKKGQTQSHQPGNEYEMDPKPIYIKEGYKGSGLLKDKVAIITGADSGIGRAVAVLFAHEGADIVISYLDEDHDAQDTLTEIEKVGRKGLIIKGDVSQSSQCKEIVEQTLKVMGKIDLVINNAGVQYPQNDLSKISDDQLYKTFATNIFAHFYLTREALPYLQKGANIINTASITAYHGNEELIDYSSTKGAIVSFTRSLSTSLAKKGIRVNGVAPGPIWTPLIPATFDKDKVATFGEDTPLQRPGEPYEVATCFLFLASEQSSYITGQFLHPNGGHIINT